MRVKVGDELSNNHALCGGSPLGSILGCYLYCAATQKLNLSIIENNNPSPQRHTTPTPPMPESTPGSPSSGFGLLDYANDSGTSMGSSTYSFRTADGGSSLDDSSDDGLIGLALLLDIFKYVDHTTVTKTVMAEEAIRHIATTNPTEQVPAAKLQRFLLALVMVAGELGMKVNCRKTQLICFSPANGYRTWASREKQSQMLTVTQTRRLSGSRSRLSGSALVMTVPLGIHVIFTKLIR